MSLEEELKKVKAERDDFKTEYEKVRIERNLLLREMRRICQQVDFSCDQLKDVDAFGRKKS